MHTSINTTYIYPCTTRVPGINVMEVGGRGEVRVQLLPVALRGTSAEM